MSNYYESRKISDFPRVLLEGNLDLTYRCNNDCRHCWLRVPDTPEEQQRELHFDELRRIVEEARRLGCRTWGLSGGEPMLRHDFIEIFRLITRGNAAYTLNTNATLITPKIARLMKRRGMKMVALYGATARVHDHITRRPGSFDATMRGMAYLSEAGAGFVVQIVLMKDNYQQMKRMIRLALSRSPVYRIGAPWLYPRADGHRERNREIFNQRLAPRHIVELEGSSIWQDGATDSCLPGDTEKGLFADCIAIRQDFHVDPYGQASFCSFIKDTALRYDLRRGSVEDFWEEFVPSLAGAVTGLRRSRGGCNTCHLRADCPWCPVYGYLECGRYTAKVDYLCSIAKETRKTRDRWGADHVRHYGIAGMTIRVESDLPVTDRTFHPKFKVFEINNPGRDLISLRHHFAIPEIDRKTLGKPAYHRPPWAIYRRGESWLYLGISSEGRGTASHQVALFNDDHTRGHIYNRGKASFRKGDHQSLTLFPTDQILLARVLADRKGCYLHASGVVLDGKGLLFVGHSEAGKSTITSMLRGHAEILCDDRIIVRQWPKGFRIHGTWSHGDVADVSAGEAPLRAILFLRKGAENRLGPLDNRKDGVRPLLACLIKPLVTADWWEKTLSLVETMVHEVPCYYLSFDRSGRVVDLLKRTSWGKRRTSKK